MSRPQSKWGMPATRSEKPLQFTKVSLKFTKDIRAHRPSTENGTENIELNNWPWNLDSMDHLLPDRSSFGGGTKHYKTTEETCVILKISRFFWPSQYLRILMESSRVQLCLIPIIRLLRIQVKQRACIEAHENTIAMTSRSLKTRQKICGIVLHVLRFSNCSMSTLCALNLCFSFSACQETAGSTRRLWQHGSINRHAIQTSSSARLVACALHDHYRNAHSYSQLSNPNDTANVSSDYEMTSVIILKPFVQFHLAKSKRR